MDMKQVVQVKLLADPEQTVALLRTMEAFNAACNVVAEVAFVEHTADKIRLQPVVYGRIRGEFGLSAQMAVRCISKACAADKRDKRIQPTFRPHSAMPYDERILAYKAADRSSVLTLDGRILDGLRPHPGGVRAVGADGGTVHQQGLPGLQAGPAHPARAARGDALR